jgi:predicted KAP-like P-loop ATPase
MLPDYPIKSEKEDLLRRGPLARRVASLISDFRGDESFVIGIDGAWGSGKTSFVNLVLEQLRNNHNIVIREFNPWNFSGQNELIEDFFNSLISIVRQVAEEQGEGVKKIREYASKLARKSEFAFEPEISVFGVKFKAGQLRKFHGGKTIQESRNLVDELMRKLDEKIVIVIDDTDRLDVDETKLIFKLVKMTANFPNTVFLLAYDREKVAEKITEKGLPGEDYLKKIVQVNFRLPRPDQADLYRILFHDIDESIKEIDEKKWDEKRWGELFHSGFKDFFKTVRDVKRYISSLRLDLSIVGKEEINLIDFLGVEAIRVFAPGTYTEIGDNKTLFTATESPYGGLRVEDGRETRRTAIEKIIEGCEETDLKEPLRQIIKALFPQVEGLYRNTHYGNEWHIEWRKQLRAAAQEIFHRYFQFSTPVGAVSEATLKVLMNRSSQVETFLENLKLLEDEGKLRSALSRSLDYLDALNETQKTNLAIALMNLGDVVKDERVGVFDLEDADTQILRLIYHTLKSLPKEKRFDFFRTVIEATESIFTPARVISILSEESREYTEKKSIKEPLLEDIDLNNLRSFMVERFKKAAQSDALQGAKHLPYVLFRWKEWGSSEDIAVFIKNFVKDKKGVVQLLSSFVSIVYSTSGNYKTLDKGTLGKLYNIQEIEKVVAEISNGELEAMTEAEREAVSIFRQPAKDDWD